MDRAARLPSDLRDVLNRLAIRLRRGQRVDVELGLALGLLGGLPPGDVATLDGAIAEAAGLSLDPARSWFERLMLPRASQAEWLLTSPGLEYLFLFHRDGRLREAALLRITGGLPSPFLVAAVLWRLNDWAVPVRHAAVRCADRSFPATAPAIVAGAAAGLLVRYGRWRRWQDERAILDRTLGRSDVAEHLAGSIVRERSGPQATALRHALRTAALDQQLERIACEAAQPAVRALALSALIDGEAVWLARREWRWVDKSLGRQRHESVFDRRPLAVCVPRAALIERGLQDRSPAVRRVALDGVIRHLLGTAQARRFAERLVADRAPSVRERAAFILRRGSACG